VDGTHTYTEEGTMLKRVLILSSLLMLLALSAGAGVDQLVLGGDEVDGDNFAPGELPVENESDLYGHGAGQSDAEGSSDGPLDSAERPLDPQGDQPGGNSAPVPEPATGLLLGIGVLGLARLIRRKSS
jgi:hypothetical protein